MKLAQFITKLIALSLGVVTCCYVLAFVILAWTGPASPPPDPNIQSPINISEGNQTKSGALGIKKVGANFAYWIYQVGDSLAFLNSDIGGNPDVAKMVIGQDGNVGIGTETPSEKLDVSGKIKSESGMCIGGNCIDEWPSSGEIAAQSCPSGHSVVGIDSNGIFICSSGGSAIVSLPSSVCANPLPAGNKRIFVTKEAFPGLMGGAIGSDPVVNADNKCQQAATTAGLTGTFKALFAKQYDHVNEVLTEQNYWNGSFVSVGSTSCNWNLVAAGKSDFFLDKGGGVYLQNPIAYNEYGELNNTVISAQESNQKVWTGIRPMGNSTYYYLQQSTYNGLCTATPCNFHESTSPCLTRMCGPFTSACYDYNYWMGSTTSKNMTWAYTSVRGNDSTGTVCRNTLKYALYCVEQ